MEKNVKAQTKKKKQKGVKPVKKPFLQGTAASKLAVKRGGKVVVFYIIYMFVFLLLGTSLSFETPALNWLFNVMAILATIAMTYAEGVRTGDMDVAFAEICYNRKETGRNVDPSDLDRCYHPMKGVLTGLVGAAPFVLLALVHAVTATKQVYTLQMLPSWVASYNMDEIALPLSYYQQNTSMGVLDVVKLLNRMSIFPYVNLATVDNLSALLMVDRLSPLFLLLPGAGYMLGYSQGPSSRAFTHGSIALSKRRRARKQKKEMRARQQKKEII